MGDSREQRASGWWGWDGTCICEAWGKQEIRAQWGWVGHPRVGRVGLGGHR